MSGPIIAFIVIYCALLCLYFYTETTGKLYLRAPNKIVLALMFLSFGIYYITKKDSSFMHTESLMILVGLLLSALGDILLLFDFKIGGTFFLSGNICIFLYFLALLSKNNIFVNNFWWVFLVIALVLVGAGLLFFKSKLCDFEGSKIMPYVMMFYLASVMAHGITGIVIMIYLPSKALLGVGSFLFMLSDFVLTADKFILKNKWSLRLNSALYFTGLLLMVLSLAL